MSDLNNFPITLNKDLKNPEVIPNSENSKLRKIHDLIYRNNGLRSQSAPLEQDNNDNNTDFLNSYNYYLFYHSKNPRDPHLPKPTYVPKPDLGDIKESKAKDDVNTEELESLENKGIKIEFSGHSEEFINNSEFCILSPSIPPEAEIFQRAKCYNKEVISEPDFAFLNKNGTNLDISNDTLSALKEFLMNFNYFGYSK